MSEEKSQVSEMNLCDKCNDILEPNETKLCEICREFVASNPSPTSGGLTVQADEKDDDWTGDCPTYGPVQMKNNQCIMCGEMHPKKVWSEDVKPSHSDSPKALGVQPDIKKAFLDFKTQVYIILQRLTCWPFENDKDFQKVFEAFREISELDVRANGIIYRLTLTDELESGKILKPQSEIEYTPSWAFRDTTDYRDELEKDLRSANERIEALELDLTGKNVEIECLKVNEEGLKAEIERWKERYQKLSSSPSDFQVIEHLTERCERYEKALKDAHQTIRDRIKSPRDGWETHLGALEYRLNELLAPKKEGT